jgi:hypothetical protein
MNKPFQGKPGDAVSHVASKVLDPQLAATIIAIDVPLHAAAPMQNVSGDDIKGVRIVWQFLGASPTGNTAEMVTKAWHDEKWIAANATHTLAKIKLAFRTMRAMAEQSRGHGEYVGPCKHPDTIKTASTPAAATLVALGHPCLGSHDYNGSTWWNFDRAAAVDLDLWMDRNIHEKLPTADLSYIKAALLNWKQLMEDARTITHTVVKHKGRTAYVGKDDDTKTILTLEKLLYKK